MRYFKLFDCCHIVKGSNRSIILDVQRVSFEFIPNSLFDILQKCEGQTTDSIKKYYNNDYNDTIDEYFNFLEQKEFIFYTDQPSLYPKRELIFEVPHTITNGIIDIGDYANKQIFSKLINEYEKLNCTVLQIRSWESKSFTILKKLLNIITKRNIQSVEIIWTTSTFISKEEAKQLIYKFPVVTRLLLHGYTTNDVVEINHSSNQRAIIEFRTLKINSENHCGIIKTHFFSINIPTFTESQHHNTCLNRKVSIDQHGNIKNCPSMTQSYGNIKDTTLQEALNHPDFKQYWNITKDQISVCQDCEFRHICTDCRAYVENPADIYSKPLKCGYNPYTAEWSDWSTNPLKEKAKAFYGMMD